MKAEIAKLLALYSEVEENGGSANLVLSTKGGKSIYKFTLESPAPATTCPTPSSPPATGNQAAGRRRRRNRGAAARARRNQQVHVLPTSPCITDSVQTVNLHVGASGCPEPLDQ